MAALIRRLLPDTLFGRLALLLLVFVLASHALALTVMFELRPHPPGPPPGMPPGRGPGPPPMMTLALLLDIGVRLGALLLAAWIAASWLSQPIKRLAAAAQELGRSIASNAARGEPLPEAGPAECREATRVFNDMQAQIRQQLEERDRFVAAVSHDLRTPLTRLRLRAEALADPAQQQQFGRDIAEMDEMIRATLDCLRGAAAAEPLVRLDVASLAQSIAEDQQAAGHDVRCSGTAAPLPARLTALRRCVVNLVDNAVRYGGAAEIRLVDAAAALQIEVRDRGPASPTTSCRR